MRNVRGSAVFFAAVIAQTLVLVLFFTSSIGYLWYNVIGCTAVLLFAWILQLTVFRNTQPAAARQ
jgi:solute:Na+ symporter, SSS family